MAGSSKESYQIDPKDSWVIAALRKKSAEDLLTPGWEDSTLGNIFVANVVRGDVSNFSGGQVGRGADGLPDRNGTAKYSANDSIGFFQIWRRHRGGFSIFASCPLITQDLREKCSLWGYFCQISDSTTSYGSYSGAVPNEKITWGKLEAATPRFVIESDASIVAPLMLSLHPGPLRRGKSLGA